MIIYSVCNSCYQSFSLTVMPGHTELMNQIRDEDEITCPCPRLCGGKINIVNIPELSNASRTPPMVITAQELYQAVNGMGLPDEIPSDPLVVDALLRANKIAKTVMEEVNGRVYIHEVVLENGVVVHFASAARGACILKTTKERPCRPESSQKD